jgi:hypothetical protein
MVLAISGLLAFAETDFSGVVEKPKARSIVVVKPNCVVYVGSRHG